ncbi:hypothetical protein C9374_000223 [Naegleria lovaniensis]|uniref:Peptidase S1 domain-containing protein n=1 Tax=Naegleria lovaniensis TaxID=51637 RepID=A0AA88GZD9_NAELO|nr:uncharacterized protein C9374_000223 [Naegleria lovaniensis]KAG2388784.1 hypothetical protein C9374_000223 [Naegleria lovaniensis]
MFSPTSLSRNQVSLPNHHDYRKRFRTTLTTIPIMFILFLSLLLSPMMVQSKPMISGGSQVVQSHQFPFYGGITLPGIDKIICSGFFYKEEYFISLANCQGNNYKVTDLLIYAGSNDRRCWDSNVPCAVFNVVSTVTHPGYSAKSLANDIGIYKLKDSISTVVKNRSDVVVSTLDITDELPAFNSTFYDLMGWGRLNVSSSSGPYLLRTIQQTIVADTLCVNADTNGKYNPEIMKCVNGGGHGGCLGDGGSPLIFKNNTRYEAAAMFSFSLGNTDKICDEGTYHAYLHLPKYKKWIDETINSLESDGVTLFKHFSHMVVLLWCLILLLNF